MHRTRHAVILSLGALCAVNAANAQFVEPAGDLAPCNVFPGLQTFFVGTLPGDPPSVTDPTQWDFYTFFGLAGQVIEFDMNREIGELDAFLSLWQGDPSGVLLSSFTDPITSSDGSISVVGSLDDEAPAAFPGPFGDPFGAFTLPADGTYFVIAAGNASDPGGGDGNYSYNLRAVSLSTITNISAATSHPTVQDAISNASDFDVIELGCGIIRENGITVDRPVTIIGADAESTIIEAELADRVFTVTDAADGAEFREFTVSAGNTLGFGGGFFLSPGAECSMTDLRITGCDSNGGGAIFISGGASPALRTILNATNCVFDFNDSVNNGGGGGTGGAVASFFDSAMEATFVNCLFNANTADGDGSAILTDGLGKLVNLINCTLANNSSSGSPRLLQTCCGGVLTIVNTIFADNLGSDITDFGASGSTIARSILTPGTALTGVVETGVNFPGVADFADPLFGDYSLAEGSLGIDFADFQAYEDFSASFTDLNGESRLNDDPGLLNQGVGALTILDIGAYEFQGASCRMDINGDGVVDTADLGLLIGAFGTFCP